MSKVCINPPHEMALCAQLAPCDPLQNMQHVLPEMKWAGLRPNVVDRRMQSDMSTGTNICTAVIRYTATCRYTA